MSICRRRPDSQRLLARWPAAPIGRGRQGRQGLRRRRRRWTSASFSAGQGEVHALVGENGAGKMHAHQASRRPAAAGFRRNPDAGPGRQLQRPGQRACARRLDGVPGTHLAALDDGGGKPAHPARAARPFGLIDRGRMVEEAEAMFARSRRADNRSARRWSRTSRSPSARSSRSSAPSPKSPTSLFLDEPTRRSSSSEVEWLFGLIRDLRAAASLHHLHLASLERDPQHRRSDHDLSQRQGRRHLYRDRRGAKR